MKLSKVASSPVAVLNPSDTLNKAMQQMWRLNCEHLPVVKNSEVIGLLAERDLFLHANGDRYAAHELAHTDIKHVLGSSRVDDIMSAPARTLSPDDSVETAARLLLSEEIHAIPLVNNGSLVGIVTDTDLLKCYFDDRHLMPGDFANGQVTDYMSSHVFSVRPSDLKPKVIRLMRDKQIRHIPVVDENDAVVGIVSDSDLLLGRKIDRWEGRLSLDNVPTDSSSLIADLMTAHPEVLNSASTLRDVARIMVQKNIGCVPIVIGEKVTGAGEKLAGIVTSTDLIRTLAHAYD